MPVPPVNPEDIQLSNLDKQIYAALNADPEARSKLLPEVKRLFPSVSLPDFDAKVNAEKAVEEKVKPLLERIEELQTKLKSREDNEFWEQQRDILRRRGKNDEDIKKFEERLATEWSGGKMDYGDIDTYFTLKDMPLPPAGVGTGASGYRRSDMETDWRKDIRTDPSKNPSHKLYKGDKKEHFRDRWDKLGGLYGKR